MSQLLNTPTLVNQLVNSSADEKCETNCVLHMAA